MPDWPPRSRASSHAHLRHDYSPNFRSRSRSPSHVQQRRPLNLVTSRHQHGPEKVGSGRMQSVLPLITSAARFRRFYQLSSNMVVDLNVCPTSRTVDGELAWFGRVREVFGSQAPGHRPVDKTDRLPWVNTGGHGQGIPPDERADQPLSFFYFTRNQPTGSIRSQTDFSSRTPRGNGPCGERSFEDARAGRPTAYSGFPLHPAA